MGPSLRASCSVDEQRRPANATAPPGSSRPRLPRPPQAVMHSRGRPHGPYAAFRRPLERTTRDAGPAASARIAPRTPRKAAVDPVARGSSATSSSPRGPVVPSGIGMFLFRRQLRAGPGSAPSDQRPRRAQMLRNGCPVARTRRKGGPPEVSCLEVTRPPRPSPAPSQGPGGHRPTARLR